MFDWLQPIRTRLSLYQSKEKEKEVQVEGAKGESPRSVSRVDWKVSDTHGRIQNVYDSENDALRTFQIPGIASHESVLPQNQHRQ